MSGRSPAGVVGTIALVAALLAAAIQVQAAREREYPAPPVGDDAVYITSGSAMRRLSGAYAALAADVYWIRAIQYYGGARRRLIEQPPGPEPPPMLAAIDTREYGQLYTLLDITTTLDPLFDIAYRFGAVFLAEAFPSGAGRVDLAVKLLEKGMAARPDKWEYMQDTGFVYYWYAHDYPLASAWFGRPARCPARPCGSKGSPRRDAGAGRRSAIVAADGRRFWNVRSRLAAQFCATRPGSAAGARWIDAIQAKLDAFRRAGADRRDWATVVQARVFPAFRLIRAAPHDLTGDGLVRLSPSSPLLPLPAGRAAQFVAMTDLFSLTFATLFGGVIGSFLNVTIHRLPRGVDWWPASACPACGRGLSWFENIPIASYAVLRGRCRTAARRSRRGIRSSRC